MSTKRPRTPPPADAARSPTPKAARTTRASHSTSSTSSGSTRHLLCTLPPTCNPPHRPTSLASTKDLEVHYANCHAHVCEERGCGCVFPDGRLLELHQTECHDPLAAVRKDRGEKIFACHLPTCARMFMTPKTRRLHLIQAHGYPKEFFFAVTNKGVGGLLRKWGEGASLIRRPWKAREPGESGDEDEDEDEEGSEEDEDREHNEVIEPETESASREEGGFVVHVESDETESEEHENEKEKDTVDALTNAMDSLALVPQAIKFGRGAARGGFTHRGRGAGRGYHPRGRAVPRHDTPDVEMRGITRGYRGLARGGGRGRGMFPPAPAANAPVASGVLGSGKRGGTGGYGRASIRAIPARGRGDIGVPGMGRAVPRGSAQMGLPHRGIARGASTGRLGQGT